MKTLRLLTFIFSLLILVGQAFAAQVTLQWSDNSNDEDGFKIERRLRQDPVDAYAEIGSVGANINTYTDASIQTSTLYCYRVRAFNVAGASDYTNEACLLVTPSGLVVIFKR